MSIAEAVSAATRLFNTQQDAVRCPYPIYDQMRDAQPVVFVPALESWVVSRYEDCDKIARDADSFSNEEPSGPIVTRGLHQALGALAAESPEIAEGLAMLQGGSARVLLTADPPYHRRQRALVNETFAPARMKALSPRIEYWCDRLIDSFIDKGQFELITEFGVPLPLNIISEYMGVDEERRDVFKSWSDAIVGTVGNNNKSAEEQRQMLLLQRDFTDYFAIKVQERREEPREDLISFCLEGHVGEEPLTDAELLSMLSQFLVAGNETTANLIAASMNHLMQQPALMEQLRERPELTAKFIEEVLRLESPVQCMFRTANVDYEVGGVTIKKGDAVMLWFAAANRDPEQFPDAGTLDLERSRAKHLAFGIGPHFCLGSPLARVEGVIAINKLLSRLDNIKLADDERIDELSYADDYHTRHITKMNLVFDKR